MGLKTMKRMITWKTANVTAERRWQETGQPQAIYRKGNMEYATMAKKMWLMLKPGELIGTVQTPDPNLKGFYHD